MPFKDFSKLFKLSKEEWPLIYKGLIFLIISSAALLFYPSTIKDIIDHALTNKDQTELNYLAFLVFGVFIIQSISSALRYYFFTLAGEKTVKRLRANLFGQILDQEMPFF